MKIALLTLLASVFFLTFTTAQTIPNAGFETWTNSGSFENPQSWGTLNQQTSLLGIKTVVKSTTPEAHSGTAAIKLISKFIGAPFNQFVPGITATGTINQTTKGIDGGFPCNQRPVSLNGWYKYVPAGKDTASVDVTLSKWDAAAGKRILIGTGKFKEANTVDTYTKFTATINYVSTEMPDTCVIILLSSQQNSGIVNSTLTIDDLAFDLFIGIEAMAPASEILVYPNPAAGNVYVSNYPKGARMLLYDVKGSKCAELPLSTGTNPLIADNGIYFYQIQDEKGQVVKNGKLLINK